jgi:hypothetical protein
MAKLTVAQMQSEIIESQKAQITSLQALLNDSQVRVGELQDKLTAVITTQGPLAQATARAMAPRPAPVGGRHEITAATPQRKAEIAKLYGNLRAVVTDDNRQLYPRAFTDTLHNHLRALVYQNQDTLPDTLTVGERVYMLRDDPNPQLRAWLAYYDAEVAARFPVVVEQAS